MNSVLREGAVDEALVDQLEMIKHLNEKESYEFMMYSDLLSLV